MDEQKKPMGRPQIYQGWQSDQTRRRKNGGAQPQAQKTARRSENGTARQGVYRPLNVTEHRVGQENQNIQDNQSTQEGQQLQMIQKSQELQRSHEIQKIIQLSRQAAEGNKIESIPGQAAEGNKIESIPGQAAEESKIEPVLQEPLRELKEESAPQQTESKVVQLLPQRPQVPTQPKAAKRPQAAAQAKVTNRPQTSVMQNADQEKIAAGMRRRELESEAKMRMLWGTLGILCIILIAAIIYEVILGHGIKETGAERMAAQQEETLNVEDYNIEILTPGGEAAEDPASQPGEDTAGETDSQPGESAVEDLDSQSGEAQSEGET